MRRQSRADSTHIGKCQRTGPIQLKRSTSLKKATAVALCLALKLELGQVDELLELAGYSLSLSDTGDLVVKFCIEKGIFDLVNVNEALDYFGVKGLGVVG